MSVTEEMRPVVDPAEMVDSGLFDRLAGRIAEDEGVDRAYAERVMRQALIFLKACATSRDAQLSPTKKVDVGWHTFILHTAEYAEFCDKVAGEFIHHNPICNEDIRSGTALARTVEALKATGYPIDMQLWAVADTADCDNESKCHQCHATCHGSP